METRNYIVQFYPVDVWVTVVVIATPEDAMQKVEALKKQGYRSRVIDRRLQEIILEIN